MYIAAIESWYVDTRDKALQAELHVGYALKQKVIAYTDNDSNRGVDRKFAVDKNHVSLMNAALQ